MGIEPMTSAIPVQRSYVALALLCIAQNVRFEIPYKVLYSSCILKCHF